MDVIERAFIFSGILIAELVKVLRSVGRDAATVDEAREMLKSL